LSDDKYFTLIILGFSETSRREDRHVLMPHIRCPAPAGIAGDETKIDRDRAAGEVKWLPRGRHGNYGVRFRTLRTVMAWLKPWSADLRHSRTASS